MTEKTYKCDFCMTQIDHMPGQTGKFAMGCGIHWVDNSDVELRVLSDANRHLCVKCYQAIGKLWQREPQP